MTKIRLLIVGAFKEDRSVGAIGGTLTACKQLLASPFRHHVDLILIDSIAPNPPHPMPVRVMLAAWRMLQLLWALLFRRPQVALIFTTYGLSWLEKGWMAIACGWFGVPVILAPRSMACADQVAASAKLQRFSRRIFDACHTIMVQSERGKARFLEVLPAYGDRFVVKPNWIDASPYLSLPPKSSTPQVRALYMGWLVEAKGIDILIDTVGRTPDRFANVLFTICGGGLMDAQIRARVAESGLDRFFHFAGWVADDDKLEAFAACDFVVVPSRSEGMPNIVLEAMASGRAVIATDVGGVPDLLGDNERGLLIPPADADALGDAIVRLAEDAALRGRLGAAGHAFARDRLDISTAWQDMLGLVQKAAKNPPRHL